MNRPVREAPGHRFTVRDVLAGVSVALVAVPQAMAYAELAGLPSHHGLYAAALPLVAAALVASSPYLQTGPVATTALLTFGALVPLATPGTAEFVGLAALLALVVGAARMALGLLKAGWVSYLMSRPVLDGFLLGAAILIMASQLPGATGAPAPEGGVLSRAVWTLLHPGTWSLPALGFALATVIIIRGAPLIHERLPGVLFAAVGALLVSVMAGYEGDVVGRVPTGLPPLTLDLPWRRLPTLVLPGVVIALVGFAEAASLSRLFATEDREYWSANREFVSQGAANVVAGITGGFPVGGSFARSTLNRMLGATSRWAGLVTGLAVLAFLPFAGILAPLPRAVLAGIILAAVWNLLKPGPLVALWRVSRPQAMVGWGTFGLTLALSPHIEHAVLLGILMAGAVHLWRELSPEVEARRDGTTLHLEPRGVLWFGSAPALDDALLNHLAREKDIERVVIHCGGLGRIDLTGAYALAEMLEQIRDVGIEIDVVGVPEHARRVLKGVGTHKQPRMPT